MMGSAREGFAAFPPLQTEQARFRALRFPVGPVDSERAESPRRLRGAPAPRDHHLLSSPHPLTSILTGLPWRSFTLSWPLQPGLGLLRRLRPPSRTRAFWRPTKVGQTVLEFPSSNAGADSVP